jgi:hypothetical protein
MYRAFFHEENVIAEEHISTVKNCHSRRYRKCVVQYLATLIQTHVVQQSKKHFLGLLY